MTTPNSNRSQKAKGKRPAQHSPPNCTGKKSKADEIDCLVCEKAILESDEETDGHEALFCEGECQGWIHRKCAGITRIGYDKLGESTIPFLCSYCTLVKQHNEIDSLKDTIKTLTSKLSNLEASLNPNASQLPQSMETDSPDTINRTATQQTPTATTEPKTKPPSRGIHPGERKFNVVIYGVAECPKATPRPERQKSDLANCLTAVSELNADNDSHSIRDCLRLGSYNKLSQSSRPRPILLKLNRAVDVTTILANRALAPQGITIEPDQTKEDRHRESLLLGERWKLIQAGTDKTDIKIRSLTLYLKGNKHAQVHNNCLQYLCSSNQTAQPAANSVPGQTDSIDTTDQRASQTAPSAANNVPG